MGRGRDLRESTRRKKFDRRRGLTAHGQLAEDFTQGRSELETMPGKTSGKVQAVVLGMRSDEKVMIGRDRIHARFTV